MKKNKVIVFGGSGFLGSHVADSLTENDYDVTIYRDGHVQIWEDRENIICITI